MEPMKPARFLIMLKRHFGYRISSKVSLGRDMYLHGDWMGYLSYDGLTDQPKGFVIGAKGKHLKTMCILHEQRIIE